MKDSQALAPDVRESWTEVSGNSLQGATWQVGGVCGLAKCPVNTCLCGPGPLHADSTYGFTFGSAQSMDGK